MKEDPRLDALFAALADLTRRPSRGDAEQPWIEYLADETGSAPVPSFPDRPSVFDLLMYIASALRTQLELGDLRRAHRQDAAASCFPPGERQNP